MIHCTPLTHSAIRWYEFNQSSRKYHNWYHACHVADNVLIINPEAPHSLMLAAYWHDAVYVPGASSDANERCSAAALGQTSIINADTGTREDVEKAKELIIQTSIAYHLTDIRMEGDIAILLDADLSTLCSRTKTLSKFRKILSKRTVAPMKNINQKVLPS